MCARWSKAPGFDASVLLREVAGCAKVEGDKVSFTGWMFSDIESVLVERMEFHPEVAEAERPGLFWKALLSATKANALTPTGLEEHCRAVEVEYLRQAIQEFTLISSISLDTSYEIPGLEMDGCQLRYFASKGQLGIDFETSRLANQIRWTFQHRKLPTNYSLFTVDVRARTARGGAEKALSVASLSRALINLWENLHTGTRMFSGRPEPVNEALPGPISTIHFKDGKLASDEFWYEPAFVSPENPLKIRNSARFPRWRKSLLLRVQVHPYADVLKDALQRYNGALDKTDYDTSIIDLWSVLERLTGIENARYDELVRRASFLYPDRHCANAILTHLRHYRNRSIHDGRSSTHRNEAVHLLRRFVQDLLMFHWRNEIGARSLNEACEFLSLDPDVQNLNRQIRLLQQAVKFITPAEGA